jgi:hypothetical protein
MRSNWAAGWTLLVTVPERFGSKLDTKAVLPYRFRFEHLNGNHYHMRPVGPTIALLLLTGCALPNKLLQSASLLTQPSVIYESAETIGVEYVDDGMMRVSNRQEAVAMVEQHCSGRYRVVGGSKGRIEAECVRGLEEPLAH